MRTNSQWNLRFLRINMVNVQIIVAKTVKVSKRMKDFEKELLTLLAEKQSMTVEEIAGTLYVSPSTVRRRLAALHREGLVRRTHGGAELSEDGHLLPSFASRFHQNSLEKKSIAHSALRLVRDGQVIFLDGSTSAFFIAQALSKFRGLKVITNGIDTLQLLSKYELDVYSTGGTVSGENRSVLVGHRAEECIRSIRADLTFFSTQSLLPNGEMYDCYESENVLRRLMIEQSERAVMLCDRTKLRAISPYRLGSVGELFAIATDRDIRTYFDSGVSLPEIIF